MFGCHMGPSGCKCGAPDILNVRNWTVVQYIVHRALMITQTQRIVLRALFELANADQPADLASVTELVALDAAETVAILGMLERSGLADARRFRLTMGGLALAVNTLALERRRAQAA